MGGSVRHAGEGATDIVGGCRPPFARASRGGPRHSTVIVSFMYG